MKKSFPVSIRVSLLLLSASLTLGSAADPKEWLKTFRVIEIAYDGLTLQEVLGDLRTQTKRADPEKKGLRFVIDNRMPRAVGPKKKGAPASGPNELRQVLIHIMMPVYDLTLEQALDVIIRTAEVPIRWDLKDGALVFSAATAQRPPNLMPPAAPDAPIQKQLDRLILPEIAYMGLTLDEVLADMVWQVRRAAGKGNKGVNVLPIRGYRNPGARSFGPGDIRAVVVRMKQIEKKLTLRRALEVITRAADKPVRFRVLDYGVIFEKAW